MAASAAPPALALSALLAVAMAGCGGRGGATSGASAPSPPSTTAAPSHGRTAAAPPPRRGHRRQPVPGGERPVRVRATFTVRGGRLTPRVVSVPAFLAVRVSAAAADGRSHVLTISADRVYRLAVGPSRAAVVLPGQRPGRYPVQAGHARATLVVGGEPGG